MDLGWLAAVLRPRDVALHPDFDDLQPSAPAFLAAVVSGETWRLRRLLDLGDVVAGLRAPDPMIGCVIDALAGRDQVGNLERLTESLLSSTSGDVARDCAFALLSCYIAADLDDYDKCWQLLDNVSRSASIAESPDSRLIRAALLQQRSLRLRDAGLPHHEASLSALRLLDHLESGQCSSFALSASVSWSSVETVQHIIATLREAAYSQFSDLDIASDAVRDDLVLSRRDRGRLPAIDYLLKVDKQASDAYTDFVAGLFAERFGGQTRQPLDLLTQQGLFYANLALELAAHSSVYATRNEIARLLMLQSFNTPRDSDIIERVVRLFRHAASKRDLDTTLSWLRADGPLAALSNDARRIVKYRSNPERLRSVEMRVLAAAAELMTEGQANSALNAVLISLRAGGPPDLPGEREIQIVRAESAWRAAAALSNVAGRVDEIANLLLTESMSIAGDQVRDGAAASAAALLDWNDAAAETKERWTEFLAANADSAPAVASKLTPMLGLSAMMPKAIENLGLDDIVNWLNVWMYGNVIDPDVVVAAVSQVRSAMLSSRESGKKRQYSFGSALGDVASALIVYGGASELWPDLIEFLADVNVPRFDRSSAFERLTKEARYVPPAEVERLRQSADTILHTEDWLFWPSIEPYPEALRFLASAEAIDDSVLITATARLAGQGRAGRPEAAKTLAVLAKRGQSSWMAALAIELSYDDDVDARASAGNCLAQLVIAGDEMAASAAQRLVDLLKQDGLLVPVLVLRGLEKVGARMPSDVREDVEWLRDNHPAKTVRRQAIRVLGVAEGSDSDS